MVPWHALADTLPIWWKQKEIDAGRNGYRLISRLALKTLYGNGKDFIIIDVRPAYEYRKDHLLQAVNLEFHLGDELQLVQTKEKAFKSVLGPDKNRRVIIYCRSYRCQRSRIASHWAARLGYTNVWRFPAGYYGWKKKDNIPSIRPVKAGGATIKNNNPDGAEQRGHL